MKEYLTKNVVDYTFEICIYYLFMFLMLNLSTTFFLIDNEAPSWLMKNKKNSFFEEKDDCSVLYKWNLSDFGQMMDQ